MQDRIFVYGMSRSGTTLLATILDAHPAISMGYELMPAGVGDAAAAAARIRAVGEADPEACAEAVREAGAESLAKLVTLAGRCLVSPGELADILWALRERGELESLADRAAVAAAIAESKRAREGTKAAGWKLNDPQIGAFDTIFDGQAAYVHTLRDPRDVWRSHVEHDFGATPQAVARRWNRYLRTFERFAEKHPERCHLVRYEDLVSKPAETLDALCQALDIPRDPAMDRFYDSKASVLEAGHSNVAELSQDFFTSSVDAWQGRIPDDDVRVLESHCYEGMSEHAYPKTTPVGFRFTPKERRKRQDWLDARRAYYVDEYAGLVLPAVDQYPHRTWLEATTGGAADEADEVLLIRHDIDQDVDNAVKLARWEHEHGIRATYCVLHSAWYYGRHDAGRVTAHSENMVERCLEIQSLGHEMSLHSNAIAVALRAKADPYDVLAEELDYLRSRGLVIRGSSGHGERLCKEVGFTNCELFSEAVEPARGGARTLRYQDHEIQIGIRSMHEFGLDYEGYDLPREVYVSDSGGRLRAVTDTPGRAALPRAEMDPPAPYRRIIGILTHPVWWDLDHEAPARGRRPWRREPRRPDVSWQALTEGLGQPE